MMPCAVRCNMIHRVGCQSQANESISSLADHRGMLSHKSVHFVTSVQAKAFQNSTDIATGETRGTCSSQPCSRSLSSTGRDTLFLRTSRE